MTSLAAHPPVAGRIAGSSSPYLSAPPIPWQVVLLLLRRRGERQVPAGALPA
jgi:hypothetical protein